MLTCADLEEANAFCGHLASTAAPHSSAPGAEAAFLGALGWPQRIDSGATVLSHELTGTQRRIYPLTRQEFAHYRLWIETGAGSVASRSATRSCVPATRAAPDDDLRGVDLVKVAKDEQHLEVTELHETAERRRCELLAWS
jgi:hypothetical protein